MKRGIKKKRKAKVESVFAGVQADLSNHCPHTGYGIFSPDEYNLNKFGFLRVQ